MTAFSTRPLLPADQDFLLRDPPPAPLRPRSVPEHPDVRIYAEDWAATATPV